LTDIGLDYYDNSWLNISDFGDDGSIVYDSMNPSDLYVGYSDSQGSTNVCNFSFIYDESLNISKFFMEFSLVDYTPGGQIDWIGFTFSNESGSRPVYFIFNLTDDYIALCAYTSVGNVSIFNTTDYNRNDLFDGDVGFIGFIIKSGTNIGYYGGIGDDVYGYCEYNWHESCSDWDLKYMWCLEFPSHSNYIDVDFYSVGIICSNGYYDDTFFDDYGNLRSFGTDHNSLQDWANYPIDVFDSASWRVSPESNIYGDYDANSVGWTWFNSDGSNINGILRNFHVVIQAQWRKSEISWTTSVMGNYIDASVVNYLFMILITIL